MQISMVLILLVFGTFVARQVVDKTSKLYVTKLVYIGIIQHKSRRGMITSLYSDISTIRQVWFYVSRNTKRCLSYSEPRGGSKEPYPCGGVWYYSTPNTPGAMWKFTLPLSVALNVTISYLTLYDSLWWCAAESLQVTCHHTSNGRETLTKYNRLCGAAAFWTQQEFVCRPQTAVVDYKLKVRQTESVFGNKMHGFVIHYQPYESETFTQSHVTYLADPQARKMGRTVRRFRNSVIRFIYNFPLIRQLISDHKTSPKYVRNTFLVLSNVYDKLELSVQEWCLSLSAFDGPSTRSPKLDLPLILPINGLVFAYSSGFAIFLEAFYETASNCRVNKYMAQVFIRTLDKKILYEKHTFNSSSQDVTFLLPRATFQENRFVNVSLMIEHTENYYIDVKVDSMETDGPTTDDCRYWGLAIYDAGRKEYFADRHNAMERLESHMVRPLFLLCKNVWRASETGVPQVRAEPTRYVSPSSRVCIVWYSYHPLDYHFTLSITVRSSRCRGMFAACRYPLNLPPNGHTVRDIVARNVHPDFPNVPIASVHKFREQCKKWKVDKSTSYKTGCSLMTVENYLCVRSAMVDNKARAQNVLQGLNDVGCILLQLLPYYMEQNTERANIPCDLFIHQGEVPVRKYVWSKSDSHAAIHNDYSCGGFVPKGPINMIWKYPNGSRKGLTQQKLSMLPPIVIDSADNSTTYGITVNGSCTTGILNVSTLIKTYIRSVFTPTRLSAYHYQIPRYHHTMNLDHQLNLGANNHSLVVRSEQRTDVWPARKMGKFHRNESLSVTKLVFTIMNPRICQSPCFDIWLQYYVPKQIASSDGVVFYQTVYKVCHTFDTIELTQFNMFEHRLIYIIPTHHQSGDVEQCSVQLHLNPFIPISSTVTTFHDTQEPDVSVWREYHVIYDYSLSQSWLAAEFHCNSIRGHLASYTSIEERALLEELVLGTRYNVSGPPLIIPLRMYGYTGVFIGLNVFQVNPMNYSLVLVTSLVCHLKF